MLSARLHPRRSNLSVTCNQAATGSSKTTVPMGVETSRLSAAALAAAGDAERGVEPSLHVLALANCLNTI